MQCAFCKPDNVRGKELFRPSGALATLRTLMCAPKGPCAGAALQTAQCYIGAAGQPERAPPPSVEL